METRVQLHHPLQPAVQPHPLGHVGRLGRQTPHGEKVFRRLLPRQRRQHRGTGQGLFGGGQVQAGADLRRGQCRLRRLPDVRNGG